MNNLTTGPTDVLVEEVAPSIPDPSPEHPSAPEVVDKSTFHLPPENSLHSESPILALGMHPSRQVPQITQAPSAMIPTQPSNEALSSSSGSTSAMARRARIRQAPQARVTRSRRYLTPVAATSNATALRKTVRPFRHGKAGVEGYTAWYSLSGPSHLDEPPSDMRARPGELFLYEMTTDHSVRSWIYTTGEIWETAENGMKHPVFDDRVLSFRTPQEPSWVLAHTFQTYKSRLWRNEIERLAME